MVTQRAFAPTETPPFLGVLMLAAAWRMRRSPAMAAIFLPFLVASLVNSAGADVPRVASASRCTGSGGTRLGHWNSVTTRTAPLPPAPELLPFTPAPPAPPPPPGWFPLAPVCATVVTEDAPPPAPAAGDPSMVGDVPLVGLPRLGAGRTRFRGYRWLPMASACMLQEAIPLRMGASEDIGAEV